jgi:hypothetical protein
VSSVVAAVAAAAVVAAAAAVVAAALAAATVSPVCRALVDSSEVPHAVMRTAARTVGTRSCRKCFIAAVMNGDGDAAEAIR